MTKDVYIFDTYDGGEVTADLEIRDGLESSAYLSLFGGNIEDDGLQKSTRTWWGNLGENEEARIYRATTAHLLAVLPPTSSNLRRIEDAAKRDLAWMSDFNLSEKIQATASMPGRNQVHLKVSIEGLDPLEFRVGWGDEGLDGARPTVSPPTVAVNNAIELSGTGLPGALLVLRAAGREDQIIQIGLDGLWKLSDPYPLAFGQEATLFVRTLTGLESVSVRVVGVEILRYDGTVRYDGSQQYDGIRKP